MKIVIIGGFASSAKALDRVKKRYLTISPDTTVTCFTFSFAMNNKVKIEKECENAHVVAHSAGCMVLDDIDIKKISSVVLIAPLLPKKRRFYIVGGYNLFKSHVVGNVDDAQKQLEANKGGELFRYPVGNYRWLINRRMSRYILEDTILKLRNNHIKTSVILYSEDVHFTSHMYPKSFFTENSVEHHELSGDHDSFYFGTGELKLIKKMLESS